MVSEAYVDGMEEAKTTAHGRVHSALRRSLMNGDFIPGQRLIVRELAECYETSAMPIREALRQLVSDEALFDHPNRGVIVPEATVATISDLTRVRCTIEGAAAEWAASTINNAELDRISAINDKMKQSVSSGNAGDYLTLNRDFHFSIYRSARSLVVQPIIEKLWLRAGPWLNIMRGEATLGLGMDHHAEILVALRQGDARRTRRALIADISDAADIMLRAATDQSEALKGATSRKKASRSAFSG